MKSKTKILTFSALMAASAFAVVWLGSLVGVLDISAACIASFFILAVCLEAGYGWALLAYAAASALSLLLTADKTAAVIFAAFFGIYAVFRAILGRIRPKWLSWAVKILVFNAMLAVILTIIRFVLTTGDFDYPTLIVVFTLVLAQAVFVIYDIALEKLTRIYFFRFHDRVSSVLKKR